MWSHEVEHGVETLDAKYDITLIYVPTVQTKSRVSSKNQMALLYVWHKKLLKGTLYKVM